MICEKCNSEIKVLYKGLGIFCKECGYYEPSKQHKSLVDNLERRHEIAINDLRNYLKSKMEKNDVDTQE